MNREFLKFYNQELTILREQAVEFAQDYPGVAERLGGLLEDKIDPMIGGLLEGAAFLAARVQLKLKHEFADFTANLIDQLAPHYLASDPVLRAGAGGAEVWRSLPARGPHDRARRLFRRDLSGSAAQRRLPVHARDADHPLAVRDRQGRISDQPRRRAGARSRRRRRQRRLPQAAALGPGRRPAGGRAGRQGGLRQARAQVLLVPRRIRCASICSAPSSTRSPSTSSFSRIAAASTSGSSIRSAIRSYAAGRREMLQQIGFGENEALIPNDKRTVSRLRLPARLFRLSPALSRFRSRRPRRGFPPARRQDGRHRHRLRRGQAAARRGGPQGVVRALRRAGRQPVRQDARPHSGPFQPIRVSSHSRPQPAARFRDEPGDQGVRPYPRRAAEGPGRAALFGDRARSATGLSLHDPSRCRAGARSRKRNTARSRLTPAPTSSSRSPSAPTRTRCSASPS